MATLLDVVCEILWKSVGDYYIRFAHGVCPTDDADLRRWLRYWMLSVRFWEIRGRSFLLALRAGRPQIVQICTDGYATGCYL